MTGYCRPLRPTGRRIADYQRFPRMEEKEIRTSANFPQEPHQCKSFFTGMKVDSYSRCEVYSAEEECGPQVKKIISKIGLQLF